MNWKNQLTKTPYLVFFMVLISVGVGTASALITITLAGNVVVTGDLDVDGDIDTVGDIFAGDVFFGNGNFNGDTTVDGELSVGVENPNNDDFIRIDGGNENIQWDESQTRFRLSDSIVTGGHFAAGSISADDTVNRFGDGTPTAPESMTGFGDLYLADDLEVASDVYVGGQVNCLNCILGFYNVKITLDINQDSQKIGKPECDVGDVPIGGGAKGHGVTKIIESGPSTDTPLAWETEFLNQGFGTLNADFYTVCADYAPVHVES